jgi:hypothetical protein
MPPLLMVAPLTHPLPFVGITIINYCNCTYNHNSFEAKIPLAMET